MQYLRGTLQYCGTNYKGWQVQPNCLTIQQILQDIISKITNETIKVKAAGRTDAGVHALGQVISFCTNSGFDPMRLKRAINALLPKDIRLLDLTPTDGGFHPRYSAKMKSYLYLIHLGQDTSPFIAPFVWEVRYALSLDKIKEASRHLIGSHDFAAFMASGAEVSNTVRTVYCINISFINEIPFLGQILQSDLLSIEITANGFLKQMVRNIVGTLVDIGRGHLSLETVKFMLNSGDRTMGGITAPAKGLFLKKVYYDSGLVGK